MPDTKYICENGITLMSLEDKVLFEIMDELNKVDPDNLVTVQIGEGWDGELYLYGIYENTPEWVYNYRQSGGVWQYDTPQYYEEMILNEIKRRGLYATNVRPAVE